MIDRGDASVVASKEKSRLDSVDLILRHHREQFSPAFPEGEGRL